MSGGTEPVYSLEGVEPWEDRTAETLFDRGLPDVDKPSMGQFHGGARDTEVAAAKLIYPKAGQKRERCLRAFIAAGDRGLTDHELAEQTGIYLYTAAPRRVELVRMGWLEDSEQRREVSSSSTAIVWTLTAQAKLRLSHGAD